MISATSALIGSYDYGEVARSILIAIAGSYSALELAGRVSAARGPSCARWLAGGAIVMGIGIWGMHFKGMLAFRLPVPVAYYWPAVLASLAVAVFASATALYIVNRQSMGPVRLWTGGFIMGSGMAGMHYIEMAALRLAAVCRYDLRFVILSVVIAIVFSLAAFTLAFGLREETRGRHWRIASALMMGAAISVTHYTGMASATFIASSAVPNLSRAVSISPLANAGVAMITLVVLGVAIVTSSADRQAKADARGISEELEQRVAERTGLLDAANQALRKEIAERERTEQSLRLFRMLIDQSNDAIAVIDPETLGFIDASEKACIDLGYSREELLSLSVFDIDPTADESKVARVTGELRNSGSSIFEGVHKRKDGSTFPVEVSLRQVQFDRNYRVSVARDITERKRTQEALQESLADLARVTRIAIMGELTASIAHEINQSMAAVAANTGAALRWLATQPPNLAEARQALGNATAEANRASGVIDRIRSLLKKASPDLRPLDMNEVIRDALALSHNKLTAGGVVIHIELAPDVPAVLGDHVQLQQVMLNLIMNAIDAMIAITDRPRTLLIKSAPDAEGVLVEVADSGKGLDPEQASRIFDSFFTTKEEGIGMGLSISRSIVESHGGRLWFTPGPAHGAILHLILPKRSNA
jgi:PAS domain S-box-containing protein